MTYVLLLNCPQNQLVKHADMKNTDFTPRPIVYEYKFSPNNSNFGKCLHKRPPHFRELRSSIKDKNAKITKAYDLVFTKFGVVAFYALLITILSLVF